MENSTRQKMKADKRLIALAAGGIVLLLMIIALARSFNASKNTRDDQTQKVALASPKAVVPINKDFTFTAGTAPESVKFKYVIETAEVKDDIIIRGQRWSAVDGKLFLILNIKVTNDSNQPVSIKTIDYVRLYNAANEQEAIAPDYHNDPLTVQAISTKPTLIGFTIKEGEKDLKLKVGEISGEKTTIDVKL